MSSPDPLETALGYLELEMFLDYRNSIELSQEERTSEPAFEERLRAITTIFANSKPTVNQQRGIEFAQTPDL